VLEDGKHDVVSDQTFGGPEEAEIAHDDESFVGAQPV